MIDKLTHITAGEKQYPLAFTMNVMEELQEHFGSLDAWSNAIQPDEGEPKFRDVIHTFQTFINEGIDIENEDAEEKREFLTHKQVGRIISNIGIQEAGTLIRSLTSSSTKTGNEPDPNE